MPVALIPSLKHLNDILMPASDSTATRLARQLTAVIMAHGLASVAQAQVTNHPPAVSTPATNAPSTKLPDVVVKGQQEPATPYKPEAVSSPKYTQPLRDTPQTLNVVPRAVFEDQGATTLRDVIRNVPGISFQAGEGGVPAGDQMSIRGFSSRTDMFVDGVRDVAGYTRDAFNVEAVEISKGPNSAYSGRGSTGGAVNMVSKSPKLDPSYGGSASIGTDQYYRTTADLNQPIPELGKLGIEGSAFRINGLFHDQDFAGRDFVHDQRWAVAPSLAFGLGTDTRVILRYQHLQENNLPSYGLPFVSNSNNPFGGASAVGKVAPLPFDSFLGLADRDYEDITSDTISGRIEHDFNDKLTLRNNTTYGRTVRDSVITAPRVVAITAANANDPVFGPNTSVPGVGGNYGLNHEFQSRDQTDDVIANQTDFAAKFDTGRFEHNLVTSLEYTHETELNYLRSATAGTAFPFPAHTSNPFNSNPYDPFHPFFRTGAKNEAITDDVGLSAFDTVKLSEKWLLSFGARGDYYDTTYNQTATTGALTRFERSDLEPTWRTGLVYKPVETGSIYFGYGTSFNPSAEGFTLAANNVDLEPEFSNSYELGTKWDFFKERLSLSAALFRTDKQNYRNTDPVTSIVTTSGEVQVQGIEFGLSGKITDDWSVYGGYAIMESEILKSSTRTTYNGVSIAEQGHQLSNTPSQTGSLWTTYNLPLRFTVGTGVQFVDKRYSNNIETSSVPGYWLQDAMVSWKANDHLDLRLNVSNLWDTEYIDRVGGGHSIPGIGRTVILTASVKF